MRGGSMRLALSLIIGIIAVTSGIVMGGQYVDPNKLPEQGATPIIAPKKAAYVAKATPAALAALKAPPGFTVSLLTEGLPAGSRWMSMAPNGDIFVSGYASNQIMVLRDGGKD